jgi:hypothetical protein
MKEGASSLTEYFHAMLANTRWSEFGTVLLMAASYATLVAVLLGTSMNRLIDYSVHTEQIAVITWVVLFSLMQYQLQRIWKAYCKQLIDLAQKNIFERGLLLNYTWEAIELNEKRAQVRQPTEQLTRPLLARTPTRLIDVLERFVRAYAKLCDERGLSVIVERRARTWQQQLWLLAFYLAGVMHFGWAALEVYAAYGAFPATALVLIAMFLGTVVGSHQTRQYLLLDVAVRRALLREFLGV